MGNLSEFLQTVRESIVRSTRMGDIDYCELEMMSPLFPEKVTICVYLDQPLDKGISARQLRLISEFVEMKTGIDEIKQALYEHWDNNSDYWCVDVDIKTPEDAYVLSTLTSLVISSKDHWWDPGASQLRFSVPWDPEHGAGVFIRDGKIGEFGDY